MSNVVPLPTPQNVNELWEAYASLNRLIVDRPSMVLDRGFMERRALAEKQWKEAFYRWAK